MALSAAAGPACRDRCGAGKPCSQIRNPKSETRRKSEIRDPKSESASSPFNRQTVLAINRKERKERIERNLCWFRTKGLIHLPGEWKA